MPSRAASTSTRTRSTPPCPISFRAAAIHMSCPLDPVIPPLAIVIRHRIDKSAALDTVPYQESERVQSRDRIAASAAHRPVQRGDVEMERQRQIDLLNRLLHYVDTRTTCLADAPWRNDVAVYTDPAQLAREHDLLFRRHPILMGFASDWPTPSAFRTDDYAGVPVLIVRGRDGVLRAFLNVCRHRGAQVAQGVGEARVFSCPYHAWTYDLAGRVTGIPHEQCFPGVRAERPSLTALPLCEKDGLVWVVSVPAADGGARFDVA